MAGYEVFGEEERRAINEIFDLNGGILFAHGFDALRKGVYRVREFERAFATRLGAKHAQAVSSGTAAIKVALQALGVGRGDEVITQSFTFVATVEAILETGAKPVIVDIDDTLNMDPRAFEAAITPKTKAVVPVHMMGEAAALDEIVAIARRHKILVMEDTAQALGARYKGRMLGTIGDIAAFSTDAGKTINTGEGGLVVTNEDALYERARGLHDHGHEYSKTLGRGQEGAICVGFNFRMTELQGAVGLAQLAKLDMIVGRQRENKAKLMARLRKLPLKFRRSLDGAGDLSDTIVFFLASSAKANAFVAEMAKEGLGTKNLPDAVRWHFARHWQHMFEATGYYRDSYRSEWRASADLLERAVAIPVMVKMDDARIDTVASKLESITERVVSSNEPAA
ncbi:MAG TPA: DegT/DnrJ/EryC1/StrS family aminotransferase [Alphaproteobacteria bacterium]|nr:DegT/DnrJ/EryC1/StrS family aminotransferase [Alphaproteobacteria bacterium]